jgi:hypothetical protein
MTWNPMSPKDPILYARDYRDVLKSRFEDIRKEKPFFSHAFCARKLNTSRAYISLVLAKKRHLPPERLTSVIKLFEISPNDAVIFHLLFLTSWLEHAPLKSVCAMFLKISRYDKALFGKVPLLHERVRVKDDLFLGDDLATLIHAMALLHECPNESRWIHSKMKPMLQNKFSPQMIEDKKNELVKKGYLKIQNLAGAPRGQRLVPGKTFSPPTSLSQASSRFRKHLPAAALFLDSIQSEEHLSPGAMFSLRAACTQDELPKALKLLHEFEEKLYQLGSPLDPLTQVIQVTAHIATLVSVDERV